MKKIELLHFKKVSSSFFEQSQFEQFTPTHEMDLGFEDFSTPMHFSLNLIISTVFLFLQIAKKNFWTNLQTFRVR